MKGLLVYPQFGERITKTRMTTQVGTPTHPLRVAIIGSGPSGFYAAEHLQKQQTLTIEIDMFDRLPTPYGLVRGGVAPDHAKIKSVTKVYDKIAAHPNFRFYGNVEIGKDIAHAELVDHYHMIIYAVGAQTDKRLDIPGEDLAGSHAATEFVAWYNGHPDYRDFQFDLTQEAAAVVGVGNVAMDVCRILARSYNELYQTDIADYALEALKNSNIKTIYVLGRRGPAQAAYTNTEIKELGEMEEATIVVSSAEAELDPLSQQALDASNDRAMQRNVEIVKGYTQHQAGTKKRTIVMRFLVSPVEIIGTDKVEAIKIVKNKLVQKGDGSLRPVATEETEILPVGLVFRSVGYRGVPVEGVPFRDDWGTIPNEEGRIIHLDTQEQVVGEYVVGWIKRGPSGIIGTNKPDSQATVNELLEDLAVGKTLNPNHPTRTELESLLETRQIPYVTYADWQLLDQLEQERGAAIGRPRLKFTSIPAMLEALAEHKKSAEPQ